MGSPTSSSNPQLPRLIHTEDPSVPVDPKHPELVSPVQRPLLHATYRTAFLSFLCRCPRTLHPPTSSASHVVGAAKLLPSAPPA